MIPVQSERMTNDQPQIINDWAPETRALLNRLTSAGCTLVKGNNGEDTFDFDGKLEPFIANLIATDESHLYVKVPGYDKTFGLFLVYGNDPGELVCDYSCPAEALKDDCSFPLDVVTQDHYEEWSGKKQPKRTLPVYRFDGSSYRNCFYSDDDALRYAVGFHDNRDAVVEKQIDGVWHGWDVANQKWVKPEVVR